MKALVGGMKRRRRVIFTAIGIVATQPATPRGTTATPPRNGRPHPLRNGAGHTPRETAGDTLRHPAAQPATPLRNAGYTLRRSRG